jgi:hypothetical protein
MKRVPHMRAGVTSVRCKIYRSLGMSLALVLLPCAPASTETAMADPQPKSASTPTPSTDAGSSKADRLPEVTIEARRQTLENGVHAFVDKLSHSSRFSDESIPRWTQPLCFLVSGLSRGYGEFVVARLSQVATAVGASLLKRGCAQYSANFYVVFTSNPAETLKYLHHRPALLFHGDARPPQIQRFLNPPKSDVVRVWHNAEVTGRDGVPLSAGFSTCASIPGLMVNCDTAGSRVTLSAVQAFTQTLVVVDSTRLQGIQLGQISDYVAMVGLVDVDVDANFGDAPSILRLFTDPPNERPEALTEWDRAFLSALYHTDQRSPLQRGQIAASMVEEILR